MHGRFSLVGDENLAGANTNLDGKNDARYVRMFGRCLRFRLTANSQDQTTLEEKKTGRPKPLAPLPQGPNHGPKSKRSLVCSRDCVIARNPWTWILQLIELNGKDRRAGQREQKKCTT
jgi:hypothetical protein